MASLAVNTKVQGTTGTPPMSNGVGGSGDTDSTSAAVGRAKMIALGLFIVLVALHSKGKSE